MCHCSLKTISLAQVYDTFWCKIMLKYHRDRSIHIERECLAVFTFANLGCFVKQTKQYLFLYYSNF